METIIKKRLNTLIQLAESDKQFAESEWNLIAHIAAVNKIEIEEVYEIMRNPESIGDLNKLSDEAKFEYLHNCVELIMADNKLLDCEIEFCRNIASKLHLKQESVDFLIEHIGKKPFDQLRLDVMHEYH